MRKNLGFRQNTKQQVNKLKNVPDMVRKRGVFRNLLNICDGVSLLLAVNCFRKKAPSHTFDWTGF